jgi:hypothetical protein
VPSWAVCYMSDVPSEKRADLEKTLADVQEATEQRMHSVADLIPQKEEEIHERAERLSESAQEHRREAEHRRVDDSDGDAVTDEDLP